MPGNVRENGFLAKMPKLDWRPKGVAFAQNLCRQRLGNKLPTAMHTRRSHCIVTRLHQPALFDGRGDKGAKERVGLEGTAFQLRMVLHANEPRVVGILDRLWQQTVW